MRPTHPPLHTVFVDHPKKNTHNALLALPSLVSDGSAHSEQYPPRPHHTSAFSEPGESESQLFCACLEEADAGDAEEAECAVCAAGVYTVALYGNMTGGAGLRCHCRLKSYGLFEMLAYIHDLQQIKTDGASPTTSRSSSAQPANRKTENLAPRPSLSANRRMSSPPPPAQFRSSVSFDTFSNPSASDFSLTLNRKHRDYEYTKRSRTFLCGTDTNDYSDTALEWLIDELVDDGDEVVCLRVVEKDSKEAVKWAGGMGERGYRREAERFLEGIERKNTEVCMALFMFARGARDPTYYTASSPTSPAWETTLESEMLADCFFAGSRHQLDPRVQHRKGQRYNPADDPHLRARHPRRRNPRPQSNRLPGPPILRQRKQILLTILACACDRRPAELEAGGEEA